MTFEEWWKQYFRPGPEGSMGTPYGYADAAWQASAAEMKAEVERLDTLEKAERSERARLQAEVKQLRSALEKIKSFSEWGAGASMAAGIAKQALKGGE